MVTGRHCCAPEGNGLEEFIKLGQLGCRHNEFDCVNRRMAQKFNVFFKRGLWARTSF